MSVITIAAARIDLLAALLDAGIEPAEARRESDLILSQITGYSISALHIRGEEILSASALQTIEKIKTQRQERMPIQYCLGETWFMGLRFQVGPSVLIPRPDTETLVEIAIPFLQSRTQPVFVDIGTGSGAIAVSVLHALADSHAIAIDISQEALAVARSNAVLNNVDQRIEFQFIDLHHFDPAEKLDAVLSNPPYIPVSLAGELQPEVSVYEPKVALFGSDADGLGFYRGLSAVSANWLKPGGRLIVEVGCGQSEYVEDIFRRDGWVDVGSTRDLNGIARVVSATSAETG